MTINIYNISNYDEIIIKEKSLVISDIDYQWWIDNINNYEKLGYINAQDIIYDMIYGLNIFKRMIQYY